MVGSGFCQFQYTAFVGCFDVVKSARERRIQQFNEAVVNVQRELHIFGFPNLAGKRLVAFSNDCP